MTSDTMAYRGIAVHLRRYWLRVRILLVSDKYPMFMYRAYDYLGIILRGSLCSLHIAYSMIQKNVLKMPTTMTVMETISM